MTDTPIGGDGCDGREEHQSVQEFVTSLGLAPHPEGGYWKDIHRNTLTTHTPAGLRNTDTHIMFCLTEDSPHCALHAIRQEATNFIHKGRMTFVMVSPQGEYSEVTLGPDASAGEVWHLRIPGDFWRAAVLPPGETCALISEVCTWGFEYEDHSSVVEDDLRAIVSEDTFQRVCPYLKPASHAIICAAPPSIPVIDLKMFYGGDASKKAAVVAMMKDACERYGFFLVRNHGMEQSDINRMFATAREFFAKDEQYKKSFDVSYSKSGNEGYVAVAQERLGVDGNVDMKEAFNLRRPTADSPSLPPALPPPEVVEAFLKDCHKLVKNILRVYAAALGIPDDAGGESFFDPFHSWDEEHVSTMRVLHYLPQSANEAPARRCGLHSDFGCLTLLFQLDHGGLQVLHQEQMLDVPVDPSCIVVNTGDLMQFWTSSQFKSAQHQVITLPASLTSSRHSMTYFAYPSNTSEITPIPSSLPTEPVGEDRQKEMDRVARLSEGLDRPFTPPVYLQHRLNAHFYN